MWRASKRARDLSLHFCARFTTRCACACGSLLLLSFLPSFLRPFPSLNIHIVTESPVAMLRAHLHLGVPLILKHWVPNHSLRQEYSTRRSSVLLHLSQWSQPSQQHILPTVKVTIKPLESVSKMAAQGGPQTEKSALMRQAGISYPEITIGSIQHFNTPPRRHMYSSDFLLRRANLVYQILSGMRSPVLKKMSLTKPLTK